jgi:hypothetical protein
MALGHQIVTTILSEDLKKGTVKHQKGVFTSERNFKIACRLYYHFSIKGLRYDVALTRLNEEFDLSELRLAQIIMNERDNLEKLKKSNADSKFLQKKFPYFNWY